MGDHDLFGRLDPNRSADSDVLAQPRHAQVVGSAERERQIGVYGFSQENVGVYGKSDQYIGVYGTGGHLAGYFEGNVEVTGLSPLMARILLSCCRDWKMWNIRCSKWWISARA